MVVWLDGKQAQYAGAACDVNSSLISIQATGQAAEALPSVAKRLHRLVRDHDSVLLSGATCALLLPMTPFSGAQAVARRIAPLLSGFPCELHVYHGATALLVLQQLRIEGTRPLENEESEILLSPPTLSGEQALPAESQEGALVPLPYLAFLSNYPSPRLLHLFPYELACRYQCVPVGTERKVLTLATCHWLNREVVVQLRTATRRDIFQVRCEMTVIDEVLCYWRLLREVKGRKYFEVPRDQVRSCSR